MENREQIKIAEKFRVMTDSELTDYYKVAIAYSVQLDPNSPKWDTAHLILKCVREERIRRGLTESIYGVSMQQTGKTGEKKVVKKKKTRLIISLVILFLLIGLVAAVLISGIVTVDDVKACFEQMIPTKEQVGDVSVLPAIGSNEEVTEKLMLGETASTDLAEFTLKNCEFTYYVSNVSTNFVEPTTQPNSMFAASLGHCFVSATFTVTNKDRGGSLSYGGTFSEWDPGWKVTYDGESYPVRGFDQNNDDGSYTMDFGFSALMDASGKTVIEEYMSSNYLLSAGETITARAFGVISMEPEDLADGFEFTICVPVVGGGYEYFTYQIPGQN